MWITSLIALFWSLHCERNVSLQGHTRSEVRVKGEVPHGLALFGLALAPSALSDGSDLLCCFGGHQHLCLDPSVTNLHNNFLWTCDLRELCGAEPVVSWARVECSGSTPPSPRFCHELVHIPTQSQSAVGRILVEGTPMGNPDVWTRRVHASGGDSSSGATKSPLYTVRLQRVLHLFLYYVGRTWRM